MRVLHVAHNHPPEFQGGVERYVENLCAGLRAAGWESSVLSGSEEYASEPSTTEEEWEGVPVLRLKSGPGLRNPVDAFDAGAARIYDRVLDDVAPDLVHVHHWWNLTDDLVRRAVARGIPTVVTLHDFFSTCSLFFRMPDDVTPCDLSQVTEHCVPCVTAHLPMEEVVAVEALRRRAGAFRAECAAAGAVLAPSRSHAERMREFLATGLDVESIPLGSPALTSPDPVGTPFPNGPLRVLHFGNLARVKGTDLLVDAVRRADPEGTRITLTLAGQNVDDLALAPARVLDEYDADGLRALAADADVAVFPSLARETYGLCVDEALRLGLPVVVSDRGALHERIGARGVVVSGGDVAALAGVLRDFLEDPGRLQSLREAPMPELPDAAEHARAVAAVYDRVRAVPCKEVDLDGPLLDRLEGIAGLLAHLPAAAVRAGKDMSDANITIVPRVEPDTSGDLVSVIIRTRNRPGMLRDALESVAAQTWPHREAVVCNDGGEDVSEIIDSVRDRLDVTYLAPDSVGRCAAANLALENARGTWVSWLDDDDLYLPEHLETLVRAAQNGGHKIVYSDSWRLMVTEDADGGWKEVSRDQPHPKQPFDRMRLLGMMPFHIVSLLQHRETIALVGGFDPSLEVLEDMDFVFRLTQCFEIERVPETTAAFRIRDDQTNAVTAMKKEFMATRTVLLTRYAHVVVPSLVSAMDKGQDAISGLNLRLAELEALLRRRAGGDDA
ncbi:MAG: glycosyltransferase [Planctomycetes bacterium]|nr:glycosyltransferase [Planctomycetota bacterium]